MNTSVSNAFRRLGLMTAALVLLSTAAAYAVEIRVMTTADGLPSNWVTALAATPDGKLWVGTGDAGVYLLDPATGKGTGYRTRDGLSSNEVTSIALYGEKVYVGTSSGLSVFDGEHWSQIPRVENVTMRNIRLAASPDGKELWACSVYLAGGTVRFDGREWAFMGGEGRGLFNDVQGFAFLPDGVLMGSGSGIPYLRRGADVIPLREGLPPVNIFSTGVKDSKWLLGTSKGLLEYETRWMEVALPPGFGGAPVFAIAFRGDSIILGSDRGLVKLAAGESKTVTTATGLPASRILTVAVADDLVAAGTARGLVLVREW